MKKILEKFNRRNFIIAAVIAVVSFIAVLGFLISLYFKLPDVNLIRDKNIKSLIHILDHEDNLIRTIGNQDSNYVIYNDLPGYLIDAVIAIEDRRFFAHHGIDFLAIPRAFLKNIINARYVEGASTITQQLAKLYFLSPEKTISRKIKEMLLAIKLEKNFTKNEILELYLNKAYFGSGNYGVVAASQDYFSKKVNVLNLTESALIAGLLKAPSKYSPKVNPEISKKRTEQVKTKYAEI